MMASRFPSAIRGDQRRLGSALIEKPEDKPGSPGRGPWGQTASPTCLSLDGFRGDEVREFMRHSWCRTHPGASKRFLNIDLFWLFWFSSH